ncbi:hypothetical protein AAMO2058_001269600 [Amorphochlora amoebiformis]
MGRVSLRFQRYGRKRAMFLRLVAADSRRKRDGKYIEMLGTFNPMTSREGKKLARLHIDRIKYWISVGAQPSPAVTRMLNKAGLLPEPARRNRLTKADLLAAEAKGHDISNLWKLISNWDEKEFAESDAGIGEIEELRRKLDPKFYSVHELMDRLRTQMKEKVEKREKESAAEQPEAIVESVAEGVDEAAEAIETPEEKTA